jgi:hypothetical protein
MRFTYTLFNPLLTEDGTPIITEDQTSWIELGGWSGEYAVSNSTLFDLTYMVARELGIREESVATANGSTTSLVDTTREEDADFYNGGSIWITRDFGGAGAAPEGEYGIISDWVQTTGTFTLRSALSVATGSGDRYAVTPKRFPLHILIQMVNNALLDLGKIPYVDITSITTNASDTEYSLPLAASEDLRQVLLQTQTDNTADHAWEVLPGYDIEVTATGTGDKVIFPYGLPSGRILKLVYVAEHPRLSEYDDKLSEYIPDKRVVYPATLNCLHWYIKHMRGSDSEFNAHIERLERQIVQNRAPISYPPKRGNYLYVPSGANRRHNYPGDRTPR